MKSSTLDVFSNVVRSLIHKFVGQLAQVQYSRALARSETNFI
jgi:hypothetical protein